MSIESQKGKDIMTPEEEARRKLAEEERALESLKRTLKKNVTPEEVDRSHEAAREQETRRLGQRQSESEQ